MKYFLPLIFIACATSVYGNDFRALKYGDSCLNLREYEESNESKFIKLESNDYSIFDSYEFEGTCQNHTARITYKCTYKDEFVEGQCVVGTESQEQAEFIYYEIRNEVVATEGKPNLDSADYSHLVDRYEISTFWKDEERSILLKIYDFRGKYSVVISTQTEKEYEIKDGFFRKGHTEYKRNQE